jgi:hypothetical protein
MDDFEEKWQKSQIEGWKNDGPEIVSFFNKYSLNIGDVYGHIVEIEYERMQIICYLLSKIMRVMKICDFLDQLAETENDDVDVTKMFLLISHAEITMNNFGYKGKKQNLVNLYFAPVEERYRLKYKIMVGINSITDAGNLSFADILYKIRCEYVHEGNYTGRIFKLKGDGKCTLMIRFKHNKEDVFGECNVTYQEFMTIYMDALIENIKIYSNYGK